MQKSLRNTDIGFEFRIKNVLMDGTIVSPVALVVDNKEIPEEDVIIEAEGTIWKAAEISESNPAPLKVNVEVTLSVKGSNLKPGEHEIEIAAVTKEYGDIKFAVKDSV